MQPPTSPQASLWKHSQELEKAPLQQEHWEENRVAELIPKRTNRVLIGLASGFCLAFLDALVKNIFLNLTCYKAKRK